MRGKAPMRKDAEMAKRAVWWDDEADDGLAQLFPASNDPDAFTGDADDLRAIRRSMKRFEREEAAINEDKAFYDARYRLQFLETSDEG